MRLVTDHAFTKAWTKPCPSCKTDEPTGILFFRKQCYSCEELASSRKKYTEEDIALAIKMANTNSADEILQFLNTVNHE